MKSPWRIREAISKDAIGLKNCMESAYAAYRERMGGVRLPPMDVDYLSEIANYPTWVAEEESKILGGLIMSFENHRASIANIAVDPEYQGRGIGAALIKLAESKASEHKFSDLHLATHVLLHENISLYRHLGWQETGRDKTKVLMRKKL